MRTGYASARPLLSCVVVFGVGYLRGAPVLRLYSEKGGVHRCDRENVCSVCSTNFEPLHPCEHALFSSTTLCAIAPVGDVAPLSGGSLPRFLPYHECSSRSGTGREENERRWLCDRCSFLISYFLVVPKAELDAIKELKGRHVWPFSFLAAYTTFGKPRIVPRQQSTRILCWTKYKAGICQRKCTALPLSSC